MPRERGAAWRTRREALAGGRAGRPWAALFRDAERLRVHCVRRPASAASCAAGVEHARPRLKAVQVLLRKYVLWLNLWVLHLETTCT
eukprot:scaffold3664_cov72-Phaeocystis_antarctica.AAC.2